MTKPIIKNTRIAKKYIQQQLEENNVYQSRHYFVTNSAGTTSEHNMYEHLAIRELSRTKKLRITEKRHFSKRFEDGTLVSGLALIAIKEFHQRGYSPVLNHPENGGCL